MDAKPNCREQLSHERQASFVADGRERALAALDGRELVEVQRAIEADFLERIAAAGPLRRLWLRWKMNRAVRQAIDAIEEKQAPRDALYAAR